MENWHSNFEDLIHDGELALCGVRIVSYLTEEGEKKFRFRWAGDAEVTDLIGILELLKTELAMKSIQYGIWENPE